MTIRPVTFLPVLLLKHPVLKEELQLAVIRAWSAMPRDTLEGNRGREDFWAYVSQILANRSFQSGGLNFILPHFDDILSPKDPKTLENFKNTGAIRDLDLIQVLSLAMQIVDLNYRQFIVSFSLEYEANPYRREDNDDGNWGYLPR